MKNLSYVLSLLFFIGAVTVQAQTLEELGAMKAEKMAQLGAATAPIQAEIDALQAQMDALPGWRTGFAGTLGFNLSSFNNWIQNANQNSTASNIGASFNGFANQIAAKHFWRNSANINLGWQKLNLDGSDDDEGYQQTVDIFTISSLAGYKLTDKIAISVLGEYRTTLLTNFNNPGYLDIGAGVTWTPIPELVVVAHPLNYNYIFADEGSTYMSSLGAKIVADYNKEIIAGVKFRSNLTAFYSYEGSDLSNYTWTNGVNFTAWKGIGVGAEFAWRRNEQETALTGDHTQTYFILGLSYAL